LNFLFILGYKEFEQYLAAIEESNGIKNSIVLNLRLRIRV
jgi:hypothetical protein